jgi:hypothetical protein
MWTRRLELHQHDCALQARASLFEPRRDVE